MAGDLINHDFVFTNTGNAILEITGVYPSCGCTSVNDWTRQVAPGQTGRISLQFDSSRFNGPITETTRVINTDRAHYSVVLAFTGTVWKPLEVTPPLVVLRPAMDGSAGDTNSTKIINHLPEPVTLGTPVSDNPAFNAELKTLVTGQEFELIVHCMPTNRSSMFQGTVSMRTSSRRTPSVMVSVLVMPQAKIALLPNVIFLPGGSLMASTNMMVTLRNEGRNSLKVTGAKCDIPGPEVKWKEVEPGRQFSFSVIFPAGFGLPRDREASLNISTASPETPLIKVPLRALHSEAGAAGMVARKPSFPAQ